MKHWFIHGMEFIIGQDGSIFSAPGEFWSNWPQWKHEGYITTGHCPDNLWCAPSLIITDKFRSAAIPA